MAYADRVGAIAARVRTLPSAGRVYGQVRNAADEGQFLALFKDPESGRIAGWMMERRGGAVPLSGPRWSEVYRLTRVVGFQDGQSDPVFQEGIDELVREFRDRPDLPPVGSVQGGVRLVVAEHRMFGRYLAHVAECELTLDFYYTDL